MGRTITCGMNEYKMVTQDQSATPVAKSANQFQLEKRREWRFATFCAPAIMPSLSSARCRIRHLAMPVAKRGKFHHIRLKNFEKLTRKRTTLTTAVNVEAKEIAQIWNANQLQKKAYRVNRMSQEFNAVKDEDKQKWIYASISVYPGLWPQIIIFLNYFNLPLKLNVLYIMYPKDYKFYDTVKILRVYACPTGWAGCAS